MSRNTVLPVNIQAHFLRTPEAALYIGLSARTLEKHRIYGTGPVYHKFGGRVCGSACKKDPASGVIGVQKGTTIPMV